MAQNIIVAQRSVPATVVTYLQAVQTQFPIERAYLFGSYAHGTNSAESDIDIAVVSSAFVGDHFQDDVELGMLKLNIDRRIEPRGFLPEQFTESDMLAEEIQRTGIELTALLQM
jgi:hypothetical protein